jgi:crotonobetainyl-CoA:carnitine CoA-transferase CaiB-like acyl-CoA transferase
MTDARGGEGQAPPPLAGLRVLDLSRVLAGPWCSMTLADLGAEVWKVEQPGKGDDTRAWRPPEIGGESAYYLAANRNKKSLAVDMKSASGQALVRDLVRRADILVENFRLGALARMGLDYESLRPLNPRLIYCSISGYGREGAGAARPGYDFLMQAESGLMSITGFPDGPPLRLGVAFTDLVGGMNAVQAILAAVIARQSSGEGQAIDISLFDGAVGLLANIASAHLNAGVVPTRFGNAHPTVIPYQLFATRDGEFALAVGNDRQFEVLCTQVIDRPDIAADPRFRTNAGRVDNRQALIPHLEEAFGKFTTAEALAKLSQAGIPAGQVRSVPEVFASEEAVSRELVREVPHPSAGTVKLVASPLKLSKTPVRPPEAPPLLGEHTDQVLGEVLELSETEIAALRAEGAIA